MQANALHASRTASVASPAARVSRPLLVRVHRANAARAAARLQIRASATAAETVTTTASPTSNGNGTGVAVKGNARALIQVGSLLASGANTGRLGCPKVANTSLYW